MTDALPNPKARRQHVQREHAFHGVVDRFIDRVVMRPMWTTGINHENELTDNARARARGRGVKGGVFDIYLCQLPARSAWIELKWDKNDTSDAQDVVAAALTLCQVPHAICWSIHDVLTFLRTTGFQLHANADNLATEYQARAEAAVRAAEDKAVRPYKPGRQRAPRPSSAQTRRVEAVRGRQMF